MLVAELLSKKQFVYNYFGWAARCDIQTFVQTDLQRQINKTSRLTSFTKPSQSKLNFCCVLALMLMKQPIKGHLPPFPYLQPPQNCSHSSLELVPALVAFMYHLLQSAGRISAILPSKSPVLLVYQFQMSKTLMNLPLKGLD